MQGGGGGWREQSDHAKSDEAAVEADDEAIIGVDAVHQGGGNLAQCYKLPEAVGSDGDIGDFAGDGCTVADGDAAVGFGKSR